MTTRSSRRSRYLPLPGKSAFVKFALRKAIDFPIVNCAAMVGSRSKKVTAARICLNAVYVKPYRAVKAEESYRGQGHQRGQCRGSRRCCRR